jgi:hypothetical protein
MSNYFYHPRKYTSVSESREIKLNDLLGVKVRKKKKVPDFIGVSPNSQENKERMFVFNYFYKLRVPSKKRKNKMKNFKKLFNNEKN